MIQLPDPRLEGDASLEDVLAKRRTVRTFDGAPITLGEAGQLLWAAQGVTDVDTGFRTAPNVGGLLALETTLISGSILGLPEGTFRYLPGERALVQMRNGDARKALCAVCMNQGFISTAPLSVIFSGDVDRVRRRFGSSSRDLMLLEAGHAAQNLSLQCVSLGLGSVCVGGFDAEGIQGLLGLEAGRQALYVVCVGRPL